MQSRSESDSADSVSGQGKEIIDLTGLSIASSDDSARDIEREMLEDTSVPWYEDQNGSHPYLLSVKTSATKLSAPPFTGVQFFPWGETPLEQLWNGENYSEEDPTSRWSKMISKWRETAAICGGNLIRIVQTSTRRRGSALFQVALPAECPFSVSHVKWALNPWNLHPLIVYVHSSVLHIFDVEAREDLGCIRGHGGDITSLGVHHFYPHLVFTTSRDFTTRIYDLRVTPDSWKGQEIARKVVCDPFGIQTGEDEGQCTLGKCVAILTGGRSGGHEAPVLGADFHTSLPLITTCGLDHAIRIWYLGPILFLKNRYLAQEAPMVYREDKPLFSSTTIHDARVLSIHWREEFTTVAYAPRTARINGQGVEGDSSTLTVWQWLSVNRFFPPEAPIYRDPPLRGCISDYRESSSFKFISSSKLPKEVSHVFLNRSTRRPPLILIPTCSKVTLINACHFPARRPPALIDDRDLTRLRSAKRARLLEDMTKEALTEIEGWTLSVAVGEDLEDEDVMACDMSPDGCRIAAVGARETVWMWGVR